MKILNHINLPETKIYKKISLLGMNKTLCMKLFKLMTRIRLCEEQLEIEYHPADEMKCPVHFCTGEEAVPASLTILLNKNDFLFSHHRSHGYYLSKKAPMKQLFAEL